MYKKQDINQIENMRYIIKQNDFEPKDIFECGQCFRWNINKDGSYTGIIGKDVINVKKDNNKIIFAKVNYDNSCDLQKFEKNIRRYFDLDRDYSEIKEKLSNVDNNLKKSIDYGKGIRILNQDLFETIISFIISANNNIPRIKKIVEKISKNYGEKIKTREGEYYTFPTSMQLSKATVEDLRNLGLGFRDVRVFETCRKINSGEFNINALYEMNTENAKQELLTLDGVGPKVCDCILLFSDLKRFDVFPIDVWVRRIMNELYIHNAEENKVSKKQIKKIAEEKFGGLQGIAQQYLFYWKREA